MSDKNIGWQISNGGGWNHHKTADVLKDLLASNPDALPSLPLGYGVLIAPISDKPLGLRCALVKVIDEDQADGGWQIESDPWAQQRFGLNVERIYSCIETDSNADASDFFVSIIRNAIPIIPHGKVGGFNDHKSELDHALRGIEAARQAEQWARLAGYSREAERLAKILGMASSVEGITKGRQQ